MNFAYPVINLRKTGQNIKRLREAKCLSVRDLQDILGLNHPKLSTNGNGENRYQPLIILLFWPKYLSAKFKIY